jgi:hypothetical protein
VLSEVEAGNDAADSGKESRCNKGTQSLGDSRRKGVRGTEGMCEIAAAASDFMNK